MPDLPGEGPGRSMVGMTVRRMLLRVLVAAGLGIDVYVHVSLADVFDVPAGGAITQGDLFLIEAGVAVLAAVLVLVWPSRVAYLLAFLVAASAFGAVLLYRYVEVGSLGPLPRMYTPIWTSEKIISATAEGVTALLAAIGIFLPRPQRTERHDDEQ